MNAIDVFAAARPDVEVDEGILDAIAAEVFDGVPRRSGGDARWRLLAVAAAVVALVAGLAVIVGRPERIAPADTVPPAITDDGEPLRMLPSDPSPWRIEGGLVLPAVPADPNSATAVIARPAATGGYEAAIVVRRGPETVMVPTTQNESEVVVTPTAFREDRLGDVVEDVSNDRITAQFELGDGTAVTASTNYHEELSGERARVMLVAGNIDVLDDGTARFDALPDGFEVVAPWATPPQWPTRWASFNAAGGPGFGINVVSDPSGEYPFRTMYDDLAPIAIRGTTGYLSTHQYPADSGSPFAFTATWEEQPGQWVRVDDPDAATPDELLAFVESLRVVSAEEWDRVVQSVDGTTGTPATTAPGPSDDGGPLRMLPSDRSAYEFDGQLLESGLPGSGDYVAIARPDGGGGYAGPVWIMRDARDLILVSEPGWEGDGTITEFDVGGRTMEFVSDQSGDGRRGQFDVGDGTAVAITAVGSAGMTRDDLGRIARALDLGGPGISVGTPPDGYEVVASGRLGEVPEPLRTLSIWRDGEQFAELAVTVTSNPGFPFRNMGDAIEPVTMRGRAGWVTTSMWQTDEGPWERSALRWEEQPGQWANLEEMSPVTLDELVAFAETLRVVTAEEWDRALGAPEGMADIPATTAPAPVEPVPAPATTAPTLGPPGRLLVANGSGMSGLGAQEVATLRRQGADVLEPVNARGPRAQALAGSRVFVRPGFEELGQWVANEYSVADVESIDSMVNIAIDVPLDDADVVLVLGLDAAAAAIGGGDGATAPTVIGDSVTLGASAVLSERGYLVDAEVSRQLRDTVPRIAEIVAAVRPEVLVLQISTNGPFVAADLDALQEAVADVPNVILVTAHGDRPWIDANNALVTGIDRPSDNLILMDWDALADQCPGECFAEDGIHLTEAGVAYFVERLTDITGI